MLAGKRLLITGVLTKGSIAYSVAERAQQEGAEIVLTGFGRTRRMTERAAARLPSPPDVLELDVNSPDDLSALASELSSRWDRLDGLLHAIAFAPGDALGAVVTVDVGGVRRSQVVSAGYSFLSSGSKSLFFGLGEATHADKVTIRWPSGKTSELRDVPAGRLALCEPPDLEAPPPVVP